jgi:hypothetical protein
VLTSEQVRRLAAALALIDPDDLRQRIDLGQLDREAIYPGDWRRNGDGVDYVVSNYRDMRELISRLADEGRGLVLYIN